MSKNKKEIFTEKTSFVNTVFSSVASRYDLMNDVMSGGVHRIWKAKFIDEISDPKGQILDMASGTGDIAIKLYKKCRDGFGVKPKITSCDPNEDMLKVGRKKALDEGIVDIEYEVCFAEELPFSDNCFDYYVVAFGIRNFTNIEVALKEALRVLKPGGKFLCLEFSKVENETLRTVYNFYSANIIPFMGKIIANDQGSYEYLVDSIKKFPDQDRFKGMIESAGFDNVKYQNMTFGTVAIHSGYKPNV